MPQNRKRRAGKRRHSRNASLAKSGPRGGALAKRSRVVAAVLILALIAAGALYFIAPRLKNTAAGAEVTTASGLKYVDLAEGAGPSPLPGKTAVVHYTGTLQDGTKFDSSLDRGQPYEFQIGSGSVIKGWDEGVLTMKVGGKRRLIVPPALGYGQSGRPPKIPGNATLIFDVELLRVK